MKERFIVLRQGNVATPDSSRPPETLPPRAGARPGTRPRPTTAQAAEVGVEILDRRDLSDLLGEKDVRAVAPSMPMRLVAPVKRSSKVAAQATGPTWGVQAVKADTSPMSGKAG